MTKQEFLDKLKLALGGRIAPEQVEENIRFYEDYINTEVRKGKSEEEVLASLGDPRLIAKTIAETAQSRSESGNEDRGNGRTADNGYGEYEESKVVKKKNLALVPAWVWLVLGILIVVVILSVVFSVISTLLPVLLPLLLVLLLVKIFRDLN